MASRVFAKNILNLFFTFPRPWDSDIARITRLIHPQLSDNARKRLDRPFNGAEIR